MCGSQAWHGALAPSPFLGCTNMTSYCLALPCMYSHPLPAFLLLVLAHGCYQATQSCGFKVCPKPTEPTLISPALSAAFPPPGVCFRVHSGLSQGLRTVCKLL